MSLLFGPRKIAMLVGASTLAASCVDVPQPFDLDHARIMAIKIDPPSLPPDEVAHITVLVTDSGNQPYQAPASAVRISLPAQLQSAGFAPAIALGSQGWQLTSPNQATLDEVRRALGKEPGAPLIVPLQLEIDTADGTLQAQKTLSLGTLSGNPPQPVIDAPNIGDNLMLQANIKNKLTVANVQSDYSYRWFSSVGDMKGFTRHEVSVDAKAAGNGVIAVVVRDQQGGTSWTIRNATIVE
jgi:hypothetical protein